MAEKKVKFTVIDVLIILIVIAVIAVGAVKLAPSLFNGADKEKVEFTVLITGKDEEFADAMKVGDRATLSLTEKDGGEIVNVETQVAEMMVFDSIDGSYKIQQIDNKVDIYVTIEADVKVTDLSVKTGDTDIRVGEDIPVRGKGYATSGYIIAVNESQEG
ncbi:MAG: DUF4330 domain-containing protein [Oscillospiraceae bacterium]|nr:DUF4330 domain-containing protein [Oscillospiraceae bacterium]